MSDDEPPNSISLPPVDEPLPKAPPVPVIRAKRSTIPPSSTGQRVSAKAKEAMPRSRLQWVTAVSTIIVAMGGGAGLREFIVSAPLPPPPMTKDQASALITKVDEIAGREEADRKKSTEHDWMLYDALSVRVEIYDGVLCRLNQGQSFARRVKCDSIPSGDWGSVPLGKEFVGPFKVDYDLPPIPPPPNPRLQ